MVRWLVPESEGSGGEHKHRTPSLALVPPSAYPSAETSDMNGCQRDVSDHGAQPMKPAMASPYERSFLAERRESNGFAPWWSSLLSGVARRGGRGLPVAAGSDRSRQTEARIADPPRLQRECAGPRHSHRGLESSSRLAASSTAAREGGGNRSGRRRAQAAAPSASRPGFA